MGRRVIAVQPLLLDRPGRRRGRPTMVWMTAMGQVLVVVCLAGCGRSGTQLDPPHTSQSLEAMEVESEANSTAAAGEHSPRPMRLDLGPFQLALPQNPGYVGYESCRACHAERVAVCERTPHFQTCRYPQPERMPAAFFEPNVVDRRLCLEDAGVCFEMHATDGVFTQTAIARRGAMEERVTSTIDLIYGAKDTSDEVYLSWHPDGTMRELPVAWVHARGAWGAAGFDRLGHGDFARELTVRCFECHNTWFQHVPGTLGTYSREGFLPGVTCERCHGPAREHVEYHQQHPDASARYIVYPGTFSRQQLLDLCLQCHSNSIRHRGPPLSYRPGEPVEKHYRYVHPRFEEDDHVADQISDLRASACFRNSDLTCITCHDPHRTDQPASGTTYRAICHQCHQHPGCQKSSDIPAAVKDRCTDCHMRKYVKINVNFDLANDSYVPPLERTRHEIRIDPIATKETLLRWYRSNLASDRNAFGDDTREQVGKLEADLLAYWREEGSALARQGRYLAAIAAIREGLRIKPDEPQLVQDLSHYVSQRRHWDDLWTAAEHAMREDARDKARQLFAAIIELSPYDALAHGRLGTLHFWQGDRQRAIALWRKCSDLNPDEQYGVSMQAWEAWTRGDAHQAAALYEAADAIEPFNSQLNTKWARALIAIGHMDRAFTRLEVALQSNPRNIEALRIMSLLALRQGRPDRAQAAAEDAVRLSQQTNIDDLMTLAEIYRHRGMAGRAHITAETALRLATASDPSAANEIKTWLRTELHRDHQETSR
ncbi:MAG: hypothetical protein KatS3mg111_3648 [Pirellulaceae bacterium]|nr:MAG: hypothetical protein KatS3mg111_3648 [Pirellulaceae bacterium]